MMDENTIAHLEYIRTKQDVINKFQREQTLRSFYEEIREEKVKQKKLRKAIKIIVVGFALLMTVMVTNLNTLLSWEQKSINWFLKYPGSFENPFNLKQ